MTGTRQIVLNVSPELYGRVKARAALERFDRDEWLLRAVLGSLQRPESEVLAARRIREAVAAMPPPPYVHPTHERKPHAAHT